MTVRWSLANISVMLLPFRSYETLNFSVDRPGRQSVLRLAVVLFSAVISRRSLFSVFLFLQRCDSLARLFVSHSALARFQPPAERATVAAIL